MISGNPAEPGFCAYWLARYAKWRASFGREAQTIRAEIAWQAVLTRWSIETRRRQALGLPQPVSAPQLAPPVKPASLPAPRQHGSVPRFMLDCMHAAPRQRAEWGDVYRSYRAWCQEKGSAALNAEEFGEELNSACMLVGIRCHREGELVYCLGCELENHTR